MSIESDHTAETPRGGGVLTISGKLSLATERLRPISTIYDINVRDGLSTSEIQRDTRYCNKCKISALWACIRFSA